MTEWEKLQAGMIYNDFDDDLFQRRVEAKKLFRAYNKTEDDEVELRQELMKKLFKGVGKDVWIVRRYILEPIRFWGRMWGFTR